MDTFIRGNSLSLPFSYLSISLEPTADENSSVYSIDIEINYSRLMMPLALSRGILLRPRSEPSTVLGLGLYLHL